jgi:hypothetical protein
MTEFLQLETSPERFAIEQQTAAAVDCTLG